MDWLKRKFVKFVEWFLPYLSVIKMPWVKSTLSYVQIRDVLDKAQLGDFLIVRAGGWVTSWLLGREQFTHIAFSLGDERIFDETRIGAANRDMLSILNKYTRVALVRPNFTHAEKIKMLARSEILIKSDAKDNIEYNMALVSEESDTKEKVPKKLTCSQLAADLVNHGRPGFMGLRRRLGFLTVAPEDFYLAKEKFELIVEYNNN